uniref:Uncharacterized protein n=1 Tax=Bionectria ochroleuca TaxID=29856 RepID=A0A8H7N6H3_BIOOC
MSNLEDKAADIKSDAALERASIEHDGTIFEERELDQDRFSVWSVVGIQYSCSAAPLAICSFTYLVAGVGGSSYFTWCYLVAVVGQLLVAASLAEISAILPHASGQVFWAGSLGPPKLARFASYFVGALTFFGWTLGVAGTCVFTGEYIAAFANLVVPTYLAKSYHVFLISTANAVLAIVINVLAVKLLHGLNKTMIVLFNAAAFYIFVVLLVKAQPKVSAYDALVKVVNETGWSSNGFVEEIPQPQRNVPIVMFFTACLNAITGFVMVIALAFCTVAPENLMEPLAGVPILQIAKDTWDNHGWVITVAIIMLLVPLNGAIAITTGGSRLLWAFAKCGGILGGRRLGNTNVKLQVPANAVCATAILALLLSLLLFGPTTVLNGIFGSLGICMAVSYFLPILFMLLTDRKTFDERRHFNLGKWGRLINIAALVWLVVTVVSLSLPLYSPVTMGNMNWAGVVFLGLVVLLMGNWVAVKDSYTIPKPLCLAVSRG